MNVKQRNIYEVDLSAVTAWDEEGEFPTETNPVVFLDDIEFPFTTANALRAYEFYQEIREILTDDEFVELSSIKINISDEEWLSLLEKETLDYDDYKDYLEDKTHENLAWHTLREGDDSFVDELLITQSEYFNMRAVCQRAKISYSTYRGYKNNKQPFSLMKKYTLLKQMNEIGNNCWNSELNGTFLNLSKHKIS